LILNHMELRDANFLSRHTHWLTCWREGDHDTLRHLTRLVCGTAPSGGGDTRKRANRT
jgi:hypothetical protein